MGEGLSRDGLIGGHLGGCSNGRSAIEGRLGEREGSSKDGFVGGRSGEASGGGSRVEAV